MRKGRLRKSIEAGDAPAVIRQGTPTSKLNREFGDLFIEPDAGDEFIEPTVADLNLFAQWKKLDRSGDAIGAVKSFRLTPTFVQLSESWDLFSCVTGPVACLSGESRIWTENGLERMDELHRRGKPFRVWSRHRDGRTSLEWATAPFAKGREPLTTVTLDNGATFRGARRHLVQTVSLAWIALSQLKPGDRLLTSWGTYQRECSPDVPRSSNTGAGFRERCSACRRQHDELLRSSAAAVPASPPSQGDVLGENAYTHAYRTSPVPQRTCTLSGNGASRRSTSGLPHPFSVVSGGPARRGPDQTSCGCDACTGHYTARRSSRREDPRYTGQPCGAPALSGRGASTILPGGPTSTYDTSSLGTVAVSIPSNRSEVYYDLTVEATGNYIGEWGIVHHNSGKSTMMNIILMMRCCSQMPCFDGVVRNRALFGRGTYEELKTTTMDMWMHLFPQTRIKLSSPIEGCLHFTNNGEQHILTFDAFGFDTNNIENKLRSRAYSIGFFNECQYMLWTSISTALERMGRYPFADMAPPAARAAQRAAEDALDRGDAHNIQGYFLNLGGLADTNSPLADSWLYERAEILRPRNELYLRQPPAMFSEGDARTGWRYVANVGQREGVARADNVEHLNEGWDYYDNLTRTKSRDEVLRTVCNEYGQISTGDAIFPEFNRAIHLMPQDAKPDPAVPWLFGVDNGLNPALVAGQFNRKGQLCIFAEAVGDNTSTLKFFREKVIPHMALFNFSVRNPHAMWCDPANTARAPAADDNVTSLDQIVSMGFSAASAPVPRNAIRVRINATKDLLTRFVEGLPAVLIHPNCKKLVAALAGGYHYKTPKRAGAGVAISLFREPEKNKDSDLADSFEYLVCGYFAEGHTAAPYSRAQNRLDDPVLESMSALYGTQPI